MGQAFRREHGLDSGVFVDQTIPDQFRVSAELLGEEHKLGMQLRLGGVGDDNLEAHGIIIRWTPWIVQHRLHCRAHSAPVDPVQCGSG